MPVVLDIQNVSVLRDEKPILSNINWQVEEDQRWVIIGPNGAGKTTLLRLAASQIHPSSGEVSVLGEKLGSTNVFDIRTRVGFASSALASHIPNTETVLNAVMTAAYAVTGRWFEKYDTMDERRALRVLGEWRLGELADRKFGTLSDGERKRVQLARAVMTDPELLLLDEPVASLDLAARETTIQILGEYAKAPAAPAMVIVTHHLEEIPAGITHALLLSEGKIFAVGKIHETITSDKISEAFGVAIQVGLDYGRYRARAV
jgi:iron complex transport system ATP-binding protein